MFPSTFIAEFEATEVTEPAERSFDDVASFSQAAAVLTFRVAVRGQERSDATFHDFPNVGFGAIGCVALKDFRFAARSSPPACDGRKFVQQRNGTLSIRLVRRARFDHQWQSPCITNDMPFTAFFERSVGLGPVWSPPKTARTEALSMMARDNRIAPRFPRLRNSRRWSSGHTPSWVHSCSRRQHVTPLPQPISAGCRFQGKPLLRTK